MYCAIEDYDAAARVLGYPSAAAFLGVPEPRSVQEIDDLIGDYPDDLELMTPRDHVNALINTIATVRTDMRTDYASATPHEAESALKRLVNQWWPDHGVAEDWIWDSVVMLAALAVPVDPAVLRLLACFDCDATPTTKG